MNEILIVHDGVHRAAIHCVDQPPDFGAGLAARNVSRNVEQLGGVDGVVVLGAVVGV
ncbi:hypothetical protein [Actinokineospora alba]|uniref:hypothetical protein n=1 Tax=Actinokineospora alba TaxID=504798 RepID=UPI001414F33B|nr:hypothetical protein [Actinokineospora alba]